MGKESSFVLSFKFFFILLFSHFFLKAYKVVSSSEYPLYSLAGFPKAGGEGQVPLRAAQPCSFLSQQDWYAKRERVKTLSTKTPQTSFRIGSTHRLRQYRRQHDNYPVMLLSAHLIEWREKNHLSVRILCWGRYNKDNILWNLFLRSLQTSKVVHKVRRED